MGFTLAVHTTSRTWDPTIRTETQPCVTSRAIVTIAAGFHRGIINEEAVSTIWQARS